MTVASVSLLLCIGLKELGELLLSKFKWGKTFFDVNRDVLDLYAACKTSTDVVAAQKRHLEDLEKSDRVRRDRGRAFQFWQKKFRFDSVLATESIFSIRFGNLINLPDTDGEFGEGPGGICLRCGSFCAISVSIRQFPTS